MAANSEEAPIGDWALARPTAANTASRSRGQRAQISLPGPLRRYSIAETSAALGMISNPRPEFTPEEAVGFELSMLINDRRSAA